MQHCCSWMIACNLAGSLRTIRNQYWPFFSAKIRIHRSRGKHCPSRNTAAFPKGRVVDVQLSTIIYFCNSCPALHKPYIIPFLSIPLELPAFRLHRPLFPLAKPRRESRTRESSPTCRPSPNRSALCLHQLPKILSNSISLLCSESVSRSHEFSRMVFPHRTNDKRWMHPPQVRSYHPPNLLNPLLVLPFRLRSANTVCRRF